MAEAAGACTKGTSLLSDFKLLTTRLGEAGLKEALGSLAVEHRAALTGALPHQWISIPAMAALTRAAAARLDLTESQLAAELGAHNARDHLGGVYRLFLRVGPADLLFKSTAQLWNNYYNRGKAELVISEGKRRLVRCSGLDCGERAWCERIRGYIDQGLTLAGHRLAQWREPVCAARGGAACDYEITLA